MGIKTRLLIGYGISVFLVLITGMVLYFSFEKLHRVNRAVTTIDRINQSVFELNHFSIEYLWHPETRPAAQWFAQYEDTKRNMETITALDPRKQDLSGQIRDELDAAHTVFKKIVNLHQSTPKEERDLLHDQVQKRLQSQLLLKLRRTMSASSTLKAQLQAELIANQKHTGWLCMMLIFLSASSFVIIGLLLGRSISQPIEKLLRSTNAIGSGNLGVRVETTSQDEIGQLARSFDQMAARLEATMVSRNKLDSLIEERTAELKRSNQQLCETELKYRTVADFTYDWEYWTDADGHYVYVSPSCKTICGYDVQAFMNNAGLMREIIVPSDWPVWTQHRKDARTESGAQQIEFRIRRPDGEIRWIEHLCRPVIDDAGNDLGVRASNRDITLRKRQEVEIKQRLGFEELIADLSRKFINCSSGQIDDVITRALEHIGSFMNVDRAFIFEFKPDQKWFRVSYLWDPGHVPQDQHIHGKSVEILFPWLEEELFEGREVIVNEIKELLMVNAQTEYDYCVQIGIRSFFIIPVQQANMPLCAIGVDAIRLKTAWSDTQKAQLRIFGEVIANAMIRIEDRGAIEAAYHEIKDLKDQLAADSAYLQSEIAREHNFENIIGNSDALKYVLYRVEQVAITDATVMILGETGTGKELIARAIHNSSARRLRPLIKVNCASLPASLIESELFGHEKGAFTGAVARKKGRFELAHGSSLFLDEIGELPLELQAKLLRVLEDGQFERVGGTDTLRVDVRFIAATNRKLEKEAQTGVFREDLWYRLNVYSLTVPTLRERSEDISLLAQHFVEHYSKQFGKPITQITESFVQDLQKQAWPGNVRELKHAIEKAVINLRGTVLKPDHPVSPRALVDRRNGGPIQSLASVERETILKVLTQVGWKIEGSAGAAEILEINPSTLRARMRKHGIKKPHPSD